MTQGSQHHGELHLRSGGQPAEFAGRVAVQREHLERADFDAQHELHLRQQREHHQQDRLNRYDQLRMGLRKSPHQCYIAGSRRHGQLQIRSHSDDASTNLRLREPAIYRLRHRQSDRRNERSRRCCRPLHANSNIDEPLAMLRSSTTSYYEADGLGSVTSLSNTAGALAQTYTFDSFGKQTASSGSLTNPFQFESRTRFRIALLYACPVLRSGQGRFLCEDPPTFESGLNFYRYASNNPVNLSDPFGLNPAPSIPWPWPWFPPGSGALGRAVGGAVKVLGKLAIPITVVYELTVGADATGIDDARAIPKPKPCDRDKPDPDACKLLFLADVAHCNTAFQRGSPSMRPALQLRL